MLVWSRHRRVVPSHGADALPQESEERTGGGAAAVQERSGGTPRLVMEPIRVSIVTDDGTEIAIYQAWG